MRSRSICIAFFALLAAALPSIADAPGALAPMALPVMDRIDRPKSTAEFDRLVASFETAHPLLELLRDRDSLTGAKPDELSIAFMRERFAGSPYAADSGLAPAYLEWLFRVAFQQGARLSGASVPDFVLLPAVKSRSWEKIWQRSFHGYLAAETTGRAGQAVVRANPSVSVRLLADPKSRVMGSLPMGTIVTIAGHSGSALLIEGNGIAGFVDADALVNADAVMMHGNPPDLGTTVAVGAASTRGHWTRWGWVE